MGRRTAIYLAEIFLAVSLFAPEAFSDAQEEFHQTYTVEADTEVEVENRNGKVYICSWDKNYVDVYALKRTEEDQSELDLVTIEVNTDGVLEIRTVYEEYNREEDSFFKRIFNWSLTTPRVTVDYTIKLPTTVFLRKVVIRNGSVELRETRGDTIVRSRNGSIIVGSADQCIEAETRNGNISIAGGAVIRNARTRNGNIEASISEKEIDTFISTRNGSVDLYLSPDMDADIELETRNGKISAEGVRLVLEKISKKHIVGTLGSGGKTISVSTRNGRISLKEKYRAGI